MSDALVPAGPAPELPEALLRLPHAVLTAAIGEQLVPVEMTVINHFADGAAARELRLPAGTLATARRHLRSHVCFLLAGCMTVWQEGQEERVIEAPATFVVEKGAMFAGYAHEDSVWTTVFPNPDNIEDGDRLLDLHEELPPALAPGTPIPQLAGEILCPE